MKKPQKFTKAGYLAFTTPKISQKNLQQHKTCPSDTKKGKAGLQHLYFCQSGGIIPRLFNRPPHGRQNTGNTLQLLSVPYSPDTQSIIRHLEGAPGLIWFHEGKNSCTTEWLSAWPATEYEYLGDGQVRLAHYDSLTEKVNGDFFEILKKHCRSLPSKTPDKFTGGLAGHLSYDFGLELMGIRSRFRQSEKPLAVVGDYFWSLHIDHEAQTAEVNIQPDCPESVQKKIHHLVALLAENEQKTETIDGSFCSSWQSEMTEQEYCRAFNAIQNYLVEGDIYQANLTRRWVSSCSASDTTLYQALAANMQAPFSVFHRCASYSLLSVSPERFIQIKDGNILTQPIKGTRPRGQTPQEDNFLKQALVDSEKDRSENLMIVDLLRNDIARNALPGSVKVTRLFELQSFTNVHHLVSSICAKLSPEAHPLDVLRDAFPGGSITGAPKKRAMEIIDELENGRRGTYCGSAFYLSTDGQFDSNILIRSLSYADGELSCQGGGGIVIDSEVESEYSESEVKVRRILNALESCERRTQD